MINTPSLETPEENIPENRIPELSSIEKLRKRMFGDVFIVDKIVKERLPVNIRRTNTGKWEVGVAIEYQKERGAVVVRWTPEDGGTPKEKTVKMDEFMRWQRGEFGENADSSGF